LYYDTYEIDQNNRVLADFSECQFFPAPRFRCADLGALVSFAEVWHNSATMLKDNFVRFCLGSIVVLLSIIACRTDGPSAVHAAQPRGYSVETVNRLGQATPNKQITDYFNRRAAEGWTLHSEASVGLIWQK
jgi:hypothetical protein